MIVKKQKNYEENYALEDIELPYAVLSFKKKFSLPLTMGYEAL